MKQRQVLASKLAETDRRIVSRRLGRYFQVYVAQTPLAQRRCPFYLCVDFWQIALWLQVGFAGLHLQPYDGFLWRCLTRSVGASVQHLIRHYRCLRSTLQQSPLKTTFAASPTRVSVVVFPYELKGSSAR